MSGDRQVEVIIPPCNVTRVLIAYADTYFGKRLFQHFQDITSTNSTSKNNTNNNNNNGNDVKRSDQHYKIFACMWEKDSVQKTTESQEVLIETEAPTELAVAGDSDTTNTTIHIANVTTSTRIGFTDVRDENRNNHTTSFWRGDAVSMQFALMDADYIVMELRQAQDVFDMMQVLTTKDLLSKKHVILVSSLLTWFATPPLQSESPEDGNNNDDNNPNLLEEDEEGEVAMVEEQEEELQPISNRELDELLGPVYTDDYIGNIGNTDEDGNKMYDDEEENDKNVETMEIFTEDQYNRRIPHAKYYNWREAERAVAAAHNEERHLHTSVIFSGLQYGEGEDVLAPFFAQVWNRDEMGLPVYGDGTQIVPTIHVRDLVTFTWRLLERTVSTEEMSSPASRYLFAVDNGTVSWGRMVQAMNYAFGGEKTFLVPPEDFVLYNNVEFFTMNLRADNQTMRDLMPAEEDWVAQSGFVRNMEKVAFEYVNAHNLQPVRITIIGPPLSGKTCAAEDLAQRHYSLPTFTIEKVIEEYKGHIAELKERLDKFKRHLFNREKLRREEAKKRAFLRPRKKEETDDEMEVKEEDEEEEKHIAGDEAEMESPMHPSNASIGLNNSNSGKKNHHASDNDDIEDKLVDFTLTEAEAQAVETLVDEWYSQNERVTRLQETISAMERVLLMKLRIQPTLTAEALNMSNPKKRKEQQGKSKRSSKSPGKKGTVDEEEPSVEQQENAPFQDKALALMMRWRLTRADCRNQGYVLDGFPKTVAQARLVFGDMPLEVPDNIEETMPSASTGAPPGATGAGLISISDGNTAPPTSEPCDEARLPSFVFVFNAAENYLRDRLTAVSRTLEGPPGTEEKRLARFEEALTIYHKQFVDTDYSLPNFFECACTVAKTLTPGGRKPKVITMNVDKEPLMLPPPPPSVFAVVPPTKVVKALCEYVGAPHNFGPTPKQKFEEETRECKLVAEECEKERQQRMAQQERERQEYERESEQQQEVEKARQAVEEQDRASLEERKMPLRLYLQQNILPLLSKGLVEVCRQRPGDPVDFLAEWLVRHNPLDDSCFDL
ncbi:protein dpy-30 [Trypanosoma theileri]|uniref:Protein dpy-30 n=1 Tax=Trypanosoma theileri TaxID=67003 RepID=A0A1X0NK96_9TRYP|nr:protein dpy-30 [Trypanosoma theileri]ORC84883.1 protein dpy-30 [Trypanosoma theileri]